MKKAVDEKLLHLLLLNEHDPIVASCLTSISDEHEVRQRSLSRSIPIKEVIDIYSVRAEINAERGGDIKGYDRFLSNLNSTSVSHIMIYELEFVLDTFIIFTDEEIENMFGVLYIPKKKKGWHKVENDLHD